LTKHGDQEQAIKYAKKLKRLYEDTNSTPSNMKPVTMVFELVEDLFEYLNRTNEAN